jgi:hypothetical protein
LFALQIYELHSEPQKKKHFFFFIVACLISIQLLWSLQVPHRGVENAACGIAHRRTRGWPSPHAEFAIAARGVFITLQGF